MTMTMTADQVHAELAAAGTAQNRKIYARHGVEGVMYGVSFAHLGKLQKKIKIWVRKGQQSAKKKG